MSNYTITFDENRFAFLFDLFKNLGISIKKNQEESIEEYAPRTTEQLEADFCSAMQSVKLHREGKIKLKSLKEVLDEIPD